MFANVLSIISSSINALEDRSELVEKATRAQELAQNAASSAASSGRPDPLFRAGQSVHHYRASWFLGDGPQIRKKSRPGWFRSEITGAPQWQTDKAYAAGHHTGWSYLVY